MTKYELPDVWQWEEENSNRGGNRPTADERFEQKLPSERHRSNSIHWERRMELK